MSKAVDTWSVLPHGPLERLADNLWYVQGSLKGITLKRVMTVAKRADGGLVIHSAIALREETMAELEAIGPPTHLLVPNAYHRLDAPAWKKRFPNLRVYTPRGSRGEVERVIAVDGTYEDFTGDASVRLEMLQGVAEREGAMLVQSPDGLTVVLNDAVFNMDKKTDLLGTIVTTLFGSAPGPRVSRLAKLLMVKDKAALATSLQRFAEMPGLVRLIVAHEKVAHGTDAPEALKKAMTYLT